jgi:hypothetical protein
MRQLTWTLRAGLALATTGLGWMLWPSQVADSTFIPLVTRPAYTRRPLPRVLFDEGHINTDTSDGRYKPFARLLERDGFRVLPSEGRITTGVLGGADLFVTVNALGYAGLAQHLADLAGLERSVRLPIGAFDGNEVRTLADWVSAGGRALIVADHAPAGTAARALASAFGVEMTTWWVEDDRQTELRFTRENGGLCAHAIADGRSVSERVNVVLTFTGQALRPPAGADVLLRLPSTARAYPFRRSRENEGRPAGGLAQAVALRHGRGRVVVLGEAAALSAQKIDVAGATPILIGMNRAGVDNQQFALNVVHWLVGLLD